MGLKSMKKKIVTMIMIAAAIVSMVLPVTAETKSYNFILYPGQTDLQSPASKADSEQNYYVRQTQTVVSQGESPRTRYYSCYGGKIVSKPLNLSCNDFNRHFEAYTTTAKSGRTYELYGGYVSGTGAEFSHITGVWTP